MIRIILFHLITPKYGLVSENKVGFKKLNKLRQHSALSKKKQEKMSLRPSPLFVKHQHNCKSVSKNQIFSLSSNMDLASQKIQFVKNTEVYQIINEVPFFKMKPSC